MTSDTMLEAARQASVAAADLVAPAGLAGDAWTGALTRADALAAAAERVDSDRQGFATALVGLLWHLAREGDASAIGEALEAALGAVTAQEAIGATFDAGILGALGVDTLRRDLPSRQDAAAARSAYAAMAEPVLERAGRVLGGDAYRWLEDLVGQAVRILSRLAADRVPLVRVETGVSLPSTRLAFDLYEDPARAAEIVTRNGAATPFLMPLAVEALAS